MYFERINYTALDDDNLNKVIADAQLGISNAETHIEWVKEQSSNMFSEYANMWRASRFNWLRRLRAAEAEIKRRADVAK